MHIKETMRKTVGVGELRERSPNGTGMSKTSIESKGTWLKWLEAIPSGL